MHSSVKTAPASKGAPSDDLPSGGGEAQPPSPWRPARWLRIHLRKLTLSTVAGLTLVMIGLAVGTSSSGAVLTYGRSGSATPSSSAAATVPTTSSLFRTSFDRLQLGPVSAGAFSQTFRSPSAARSDLDDTSVVPDGDGGRALRVELQAHTIHSNPEGNNGLNVFIPLSRVVANACVSYDVRFDEDFDWSLGGKLPGLLGVAPGVSPSLPTGGKATHDLGWSGRMMWLGPPAYTMPGQTNTAISYLYHPRQRSRYGDNLRWLRSFSAGQWHRVQQCYTMNTVGKRDGTLRGWFDGSEVLNRRHVVYREREDVAITHLALSVFRGGHTSEWAGDRPDSIDFDNVKITTRNP